MSANLKIHTALDDEQELQHLLAKQAELQAEIAALLPSPVPLQYSCTECRRRKQKCVPHKAGPCSNCARRYPPVECVGRPGDNHASTSASASSRRSSSNRLPRGERNSNSNGPIPVPVRMPPSLVPLWDEKEDLDLDSQTSSNRFHRSPIQNQQQRRQSNALLISMSSNGTTMSGHLSQDRVIEPSQIHRTFSQSSEFLPLNTESRRHKLAMTTWTTQDQPLSSYEFSFQAPSLQQSMQEWSPEPTHVLEDLESPSSFLSRTMVIPKIVVPPSISIPSPATLDNHRLSTSSFNIQTPSSPMSDSLTTATTLTNNTSREKSLRNESILQSMEMMICNSQASFSTTQPMPKSSPALSEETQIHNAYSYYRDPTPPFTETRSTATQDDLKGLSMKRMREFVPSISYESNDSGYWSPRYSDFDSSASLGFVNHTNNIRTPTIEITNPTQPMFAPRRLSQFIPPSMVCPFTQGEVVQFQGEYTACHKGSPLNPLLLKSEKSLMLTRDMNEKQVFPSPTPKYPLEKSVSRDTLSSYSDDETEWDEDELTPNPPNLDSSQKALVERIMDQFWKIFNRENNVTSLVRNNTIHYESYCETASPTDEGGNKSSQDTTVSVTETQTLSQRTPVKNERKRGRDSQDNQDDNDDERSSKRRRTLFSPLLKEDDSTKFACPYRKHNPRKYCVRDWRPCALTPLDTIARLKTHLYRHHRIFPCQRCQELFEDQDQVSEHLKEANACELSYILQADGVTSEIVEKLRSRKRTHKNQTEVEKWQDIYKLLFPNEIVPSPYFDPVQEDTAESPDYRALDDYEEYCRRELPRYVIAAVEEAVHQEQPVDAVIGSQLMNIIRHCQGQVYSRYRSSATPAMSPALRNPVESTSPAARSSPIRKIIDNSAEVINPPGSNLEPPAPTYFEHPLPQTHLESRLESSTSEHTTFKPVGKTSSPDSGYISNDSTPPVFPSEGLSRTAVELPESNPHSDHSYSTVEGPPLEQELSQNDLGLFGTEPSAQEPYDPFESEWSMRNTEGGSWFGGFDSAVPGGTDWTVSTNADLAFPELNY